MTKARLDVYGNGGCAHLDNSECCTVIDCELFEMSCMIQDIEDCKFGAKKIVPS
jgi:hypothetical protein